MNNSLRNELWETIKQTKCNEYCLLYYTDKIRKRNRYINYSVIGISALGSISYMFNPLGALLSSIIIFIISLSKDSLPMLSRSESDVTDMDSLIIFYSTYMSKLESLWRKNEMLGTNEIELSESLQDLIHSEAPNKVLLNKLVRHISKKENMIISDKTDKYLKKIYYEKNTIS